MTSPPNGKEMWKRVVMSQWSYEPPHHLVFQAEVTALEAMLISKLGAKAISSLFLFGEHFFDRKSHGLKIIIFKNVQQLASMSLT